MVSRGRVGEITKQVPGQPLRRHPGRRLLRIHRTAGAEAYVASCTFVPINPFRAACVRRLH